jgi:hypothetical protein
VRRHLPQQSQRGAIEGIASNSVGYHKEFLCSRSVRSNQRVALSGEAGNGLPLDNAEDNMALLPTMPALVVREELVSKLDKLIMHRT